jgi:hypothetical protein
MVLVLISRTVRVSPSAYNGSSAKFKLKILPYLKHILNVQLCGQYLSIISFSSHLTSSGDVVTIQQAAIRNYSIMLLILSRAGASDLRNWQNPSEMIAIIITFKSLICHTIFTSTKPMGNKRSGWSAAGEKLCASPDYSS